VLARAKPCVFPAADLDNASLSLLQDLVFRQLFDADSSTYTYIIGDPVTKEAMLIDPVLEQVRLVLCVSVCLSVCPWGAHDRQPDCPETSSGTWGVVRQHSRQQQQLCACNMRVTPNLAL
jgi:ferredoxin